MPVLANMPMTCRLIINKTIWLKFQEIDKKNVTSCSFVSPIVLRISLNYISPCTYYITRTNRQLFTNFLLLDH